jgi:hypothetical protein
MLTRRNGHYYYVSPSLTQYVRGSLEFRIMAVLLLAFFTSTPGNGIWVCFYLIYPKLYPNSLLVSLNSRDQARAPVQTSGTLQSQRYDISVQHVQSVSGGTGGTVRLSA